MFANINPSAKMRMHYDNVYAICKSFTTFKYDVTLECFINESERHDRVKQ